MDTELNIPLVLALSVIPDADTVVQFTNHRGPTHSIIVALIIFAPILFVYRKKALPYLIALIQHSLIGDYFTGGGIQLLWPLTTEHFGVGPNVESQAGVAVEWAIFVTSLILMIKTNDISTFFQSHKSNLLLIIPALSLFFPTFLGLPLSVPPTLTVAHIIYLILFAASVTIFVGRTLILRLRRCAQPR